MSRKTSKRKHSVHWFRKGLRLSDNPALLRAIRRCETFRCIFILDPWFAGSSNVGTNKWRFLLQCLEDLDSSLRKLDSRLFVVRGQPADVLPKLFKEWGTTYFTFEEDPEPFGRVRDQNIISMCKEMNIIVTKEHSHTLYNLDRIIERNGGKAPLTYKRFQSIIESMDPPPKPVPALTLQMLGTGITPITDDHDEKYGVPSLEELGFDCEHLRSIVWVGGETEALSRLERHLERKAWVASFGRPKMTPQSLLASQTGLSPYLRFGCLSTRLFYHALTDLYKKIKKCDPPLSLHGQLLWREFFYCASTKNPNFDKMLGNPVCVQIPWDRNDEALAKWANAQTGFPWIDAIMRQLREEGWIHHLARHAVACFLTRGDLWVSWEEGMKVFDELLLDADWSVNAGTWLWLSCSSFFQQFFHCYCPVKFGRKADANGDFIRRYLPVLKNYPTRYIHEPWTAPEAVQKSAKCIIGQDYPRPMCNHAYVSKINMERMKQVYQQLAHYRQTGQTGPGIPHDLLNQLPKIPKIPSPSGGMMGPPNPPELMKKGLQDSSQDPGQNNQLEHKAMESSESVIITSISGTNASISDTLSSISGTVSSTVGTVSTIGGTVSSVPGPASSLPGLVTTNSGTASVFCSVASLNGAGQSVPSTGSSMAGTMPSLHGPSASMPGTFPSLAGGVVPVPVVATSVLMYNQYGGASPAIYGNAVQAQTAYCTYTQEGSRINRESSYLSQEIPRLDPLPLLSEDALLPISEGHCSQSMMLMSRAPSTGLMTHTNVIVSQAIQGQEGSFFSRDAFRSSHNGTGGGEDEGGRGGGGGMHEHSERRSSLSAHAGAGRGISAASLGLSAADVSAMNASIGSLADHCDGMQLMNSVQRMPSGYGSLLPDDYYSENQ